LHRLDPSRSPVGDRLLQLVPDGFRARCRELADERARCLQIRRVEAFGEPIVDRREPVADVS
jgi:hypothetical protein